MTATARIDHFIVGASQNIKDLLAAYADIGFVVSPFGQTMRHEPGLRTGFIFFSPKGTRDYIEFLTVEDRALFAAAQAKGEEKYTEKSCAWGLGVRVTDANAIHDALVDQGTTVKPVWSKRPEDAGPDTPYVWSFIDLIKPSSGLGAFYVQYLSTRPKVAPEPLISPNGIFALGGLLYDSADPAAVALALSKDFPKDLVKLEGGTLTLGCHEIVARPFKEFAGSAGAVTLFQNPDLKVYGAVLYTESLDKTAAALKGKWKSHFVGKDEILLLPSEHEGLAAVVQEKPVKKWMQSRVEGAKWLF